MTVGISSPPYIPQPRGLVTNYVGMRGIQRYRPIEFMEKREGQPVWMLQNGYIDTGGMVVRDAPIKRRPNTPTDRISNMKFFNTDTLVWTSDADGYISVASDRGHERLALYNTTDVPTMTYFRGRVLTLCPGYPILKYDGSVFTQSPASIAPGFGVAIQRRLAVAGMPTDPTTVVLSRVDAEDVFTDEEDADSVAVTKSAFIDIVNLIGTADRIKGLGAFEANRLAIFTNDQVVVYAVDPDFTQWTIDQRANVRVGTISHRTVVNAGSDLLFCSRHGVHTLSRSIENGLSIISDTLTAPIAEMYRRMVTSVANPETITAAYDQDLGHYHIFFPQPGGIRTERLTLDISRGYQDIDWYYGNHLNQRCAEVLAGQLVFGTYGGVYERISTYATRNEANAAGAERGDFIVETPILWHGDPHEEKQCYSLVIYATGEGDIVLESWDEEENSLISGQYSLRGKDDDSDSFPDSPLVSSYDVPFEARYRGVRIRLSATGNGDVRVFGLKFNMAKP